MRTKKGISLIVLIITVIVLSVVTTVVILQTKNVVGDVRRDNFAVELTTIKDKVKEHYIIIGGLPVKSGVQYTAIELKNMLEDSDYKNSLLNEINLNKDGSNVFYEVDINLLKIETQERGKGIDNTDIFLISSNNLNVYYLKGIDVDGELYFSTVKLLVDNAVPEKPVIDDDTSITLNQEMTVTKNTNVWTNELIVNVNVDKKVDETITYIFANAVETDISGSIQKVLNTTNLTSAELSAFETNKTIVVNRVKDGQITEQKTLDISNLDITVPILGTMEMTNTSDINYNSIKITVSDEGGSKVKALYYDYDKMLVGETITNYYADKTDVTQDGLVAFGKISKDGIIKLPKNIKSIVAIVVDNAGNMSDIVEYTIDDSYLLSQ